MPVPATTPQVLRPLADKEVNVEEYAVALVEAQT
jgi:hypothetical protein